MMVVVLIAVAFFFPEVTFGLVPFVILSKSI